MRTIVALLAVSLAGCGSGFGSASSHPATSASTAGTTSSGSTATTPAAPVLTSIVVETDGLTISQPGLCQQLQASGLYSDGRVRDVTRSATWSVADPTIAAVDTLGCASPVAAGTTSITAAVGSVQGSGTLVVASSASAPADANAHFAALQALPAPVSLVVNPPVRNLVDAGATQQLVVLATWSSGATADVTVDTTFTISDASVATIDANGVLTGIGTGTITVTAAWNGAQATSQLAFDPAAPLANGDRPSVLGAGATVTTPTPPAPPPVSFGGAVDPLFYSTLNCSTCHTSMGVQFKLFKDEGKDFTQITTNGLIDTSNPANSLLLTKPVNADGSHVGGNALDPSSAAYKTILSWIQSGANP
jgi:hypothetical protein